MTESLSVVAIPGIPEIAPGDDLAALIVSACHRGRVPLLAGDVVVVASKVVSKAEGRLVTDAERDAVVEAETTALVAHRRTPRGRTAIVRSAAGPVMAAAGVDASNVPPGTLLLLPRDPDASARGLRAGLHELTGLALGVVISDTLGRPWREGQTDVAIGAAGLDVVDDLRGRHDREGRQLDVTVRAVADEIAAAADLVKGKLDGTPVAVVRGLDAANAGDGPGAATLVRHGDHDWFRWGSLEAVEAALGHEVGATAPAPAGPVPWDAALARSLQLATHPATRHRGSWTPCLDLTPAPVDIAAASETVAFAIPTSSAEMAAFAVLVERLLVALRAHGHDRQARWREDVVLLEPVDDTV